MTTTTTTARETYRRNPHINFGRTARDVLLHTVCCRACCKPTVDHDHRTCVCPATCHGSTR